MKFLLNEKDLKGKTIKSFRVVENRWIKIEFTDNTCALLEYSLTDYGETKIISFIPKPTLPTYLNTLGFMTDKEYTKIEMDAKKRIIEQKKRDLAKLESEFKYLGTKAKV